MLDLERELYALKAKDEQAQSSEMRACMAMHSVGVPNGFEDGNSWDDFGFYERIHILCDMLTREREKTSELAQRLSGKQNKES